MTVFDRKFPTELLPEVIEEETWISDLLRKWRPAGAPVGLLEAPPAHLRAAFRNGYMNWYRAGQSIAKVSPVHGRFRASVHNKYVRDDANGDQRYITLTSDGFQDHRTGRLTPYEEHSLDRWILRANEYVGDEKEFVDLVVSHNSDVIDLEMGLPAYPGMRGGTRAPRMDLVVLEPHDGWWRIVFWEAKVVTDGRARCKGEGMPEVVQQLLDYTAWLEHKDHRYVVARAYQQTCRMLVALHEAASLLRPEIEPLGEGIRAVAAEDAEPPSIDIEPRLLIDDRENNVAFTDNRHLDKLRKGGLHVQMVKSADSADMRLHMLP